ncbi:uncharacterized protein [Onthophagus taurus]|uniref:uncharacterized protein n=1 Tax=Onthophagus taurus TaxID=166361 RepID=UPI000C1FE129|nr:uncharacterized protein LOC111426483 [Onthophagus taurus]
MSLLRVFINTSRSNLLKPSRGPKFFYSNKSNIDNEKIKDEDDKPIKYSMSPASKWKAEQTRSGNKNQRLWYEPYVVIASLSAMLIYFCVLREENDIDLELQKSLYARIEGLEEHQLRVLLDYNKRHGLETRDIIKRLDEIESSRR